MEKQYFFVINNNKRHIVKRFLNYIERKKEINLLDFHSSELFDSIVPLKLY